MLGCKPVFSLGRYNSGFPRLILHQRVFPLTSFCRFIPQQLAPHHFALTANSLPWFWAFWIVWRAFKCELFFFFQFYWLPDTVAVLGFYPSVLPSWPQWCGCDGIAGLLWRFSILSWYLVIHLSFISVVLQLHLLFLLSSVVTPMAVACRIVIRTWHVAVPCPLSMPWLFGSAVGTAIN